MSDNVTVGTGPCACPVMDNHRGLSLRISPQLDSRSRGVLKKYNSMLCQVLYCKAGRDLTQK